VERIIEACNVMKKKINTNILYVSIFIIFIECKYLIKMITNLSGSSFISIKLRTVTQKTKIQTKT